MRSRPGRGGSRRHVTTALVLAAVAVLLGGAILLTRGSQKAQAVGPFTGSDLHSLVLAPDGSALYVGGHEVVSMSRDGGRTWARIESLDGADAMGWAFLENEIWVGGHPGLVRSSDGGRTFAPANEGLPDTDIHALGGVGRHLYAASPAAGFLASEAGSGVWEVRHPEIGRTFMGRILVDGRTPDRAIATDLQAGVVETRDGGRTWTVLVRVSGLMWVSAGSDRGATLVASGPGIAIVSRNGGDSWGELEVPEQVMLVEVDPRDGSRLYAAGHDGALAILWRSDDGGRSWQRT